MRRSLKLLYHIIPWLLYYSLPFLIDLVADNQIVENYLPVWSLNTLYFAGVFYTFFFYVNPRFLKKDKILKYLAVSFGMLLLLSLGKLLIYIPFNLMTGFDTRQFPYRLLEAFFTGGIFMLLAVFVNFMNNWFKSQQLKTEMEKQKMESELNMLKYQVNPHFLFNTLNNIYSLVLKKSELAPRAVLKLSNLMRYMIYETNAQRVPVKKELDYLVHFIDLQKMRMKYPDTVKFTIEGEVGDMCIAPMLLIPFIENAFKHSMKSDDNYIFIGIRLNDHTLSMRTSNAINPKAKSDELSGIGLQNVKKRLELDYPKKHSLSIYRQEAIFYVDLILNLE